MAASSNYLRDRLSKFGILLGVALVLHIFFTFIVRPQAESFLQEERARAESTPGYKPRRTLFVIIRDTEQETTIIVATWALILSAARGFEIRRQRQLLSADLVQLSDGRVILPDDVREFSRRLENLPPDQRDGVAPRVLLMALKRFGATRDVQDASTTVHNVCESESARLDAELGILRFCVWVCPALGFVGTVRGIGLALQGSELAFKGDISAVTGGLGISFNSTLIALSLSILLMYILHELELAQERLVLDAEHYADEELVSRMHAK